MQMESKGQKKAIIIIKNCPTSCELSKVYQFTNIA